MKSLKFDDLFEQALKDWTECVDIDQPIGDGPFGIQEKVHELYHGEKNEILMVNLHWIIYNLLEDERKAGRFLLIRSTKAKAKEILADDLNWHIDQFKGNLQEDLDHFEEYLEWQSKNLHTQKERFWTLWDMGLAKAYLDANKEDPDTSAAGFNFWNCLEVR